MKISKSPGRPRAFDPDVALEKALEVFWSKGYEGASLSDLTEAMGISRPSLYATYGNKEELFKRAFERYSSKAACGTRDAREMPTARQAVEALLYGAADTLSNPDHPGCLSVTAALSCSDQSDAVRQEMCNVRNAGLDSWTERFKVAQDQGELPPDPTAAELSRYIMTVMNGMTVQARSGATREELRRTVELTLRAWPS